MIIQRVIHQSIQQIDGEVAFYLLLVRGGFFYCDGNRVHAVGIDGTVIGSAKNSSPDLATALLMVAENMTVWRGPLISPTILRTWGVKPMSPTAFCRLF